MALTEDALVDRAVAVCVAQSDLTEAVSLDFAKVPAGVHDGAFVVRFVADSPQGGMGFTEEARGVVEIESTKAVESTTTDDARRALWQRMRTLVNALVRDGAETSGEYAVEDAGRSMDVEQPRGAAYLVGRLRVPVNFEATL